ncbi:MAG: exosortase system-associated protein, TIGR04073 family [Lentisphaerae bacterium]|nr:exosortase system-associated protein, TIGR04073 family [Lentisphaerota bacterium]
MYWLYAKSVNYQLKKYMEYEVMKFSKTFLVALFVGVVMVGGAFSAKADDAWLMRPVEKLGRGITNAAFCFLELPMKWTDVTEEKGSLAGLTYGTLKGVCYTVGRVFVGAIDIVTFPFPLPGCPDDLEDVGWGYGPIMKPAWVVPVGRDWNNFIYNDESVINPAQ